ncbi:unnamed protein product [Linum trigynum]|uniref:Helicase C-terminal domain-containing protein n=1 Tax=Linum trigynum TaxID=586398 RepID=A0AAV2CC52_9ROSI
MTSKVLHYYKGDFLDELPGLVDFTMVLNLSNRQKHEVKELKKLARKFKRSSVGSAVYLHPKLITVSESVGVTDGKMDELLETLNLRDGAKAKFFFNMLGLCESTGEKLLVFSQYLTPLKFLERLVANMKGWMMGKEIFVISGESSSEQREWSMNQFNKSPDAKVFFGSIKACGEGISLVGASRILIWDVHLNPSVTRQAIGRAFRPGQTKKVYMHTGWLLLIRPRRKIIVLASGRRRLPKCGLNGTSIVVTRILKWRKSIWKSTVIPSWIVL